MRKIYTKYTKKEIIEQFLHKEKGMYYQKHCLKDSSKTKKEDGDDEEYCVEIIASLLNNGTIKLNYYKDDGQIPFRNNFHFEDHDGNYGTSKTSEKALCRNWYNKGFPKLKNIEGKEIQLGEIIDYESNLCGKKVNIDLTSVNGNTMYLIEVKGEKGNGTCYHTGETLLRAALEINTYYKTLKENGLLDNFKQNLASKNRTIKQEINEVKKVIIFPDNPNDFAYGTMIRNGKKLFPQVYKYLEDNEIIVLTYRNNYKFKD